MSKLSSEKRRTPVQQAIVALRKKLGLTQQDLAVKLEKTVVTVCRWETSRPPSDYFLLQLAQFARREKANEAAEVFERAFREEQETPEFFRIPMADESTVEIALNNVRRAKDIPVVRSEYLRVLMALHRAHAVVREQALMDTATGESYEELRKDHENLEDELEEVRREEQASKKSKR